MHKVAIITEHFPPEIGGVSHSVRRITSNLYKKGINFIVITVDRNDSSVSPYYKKEVIGGAKTYRIGPVRHFIDFTRPGATASERKNFFVLLKEIIMVEGVDLLHCFCLLNSGFYGALIKQQLGMPLIVSIRGNDLSRDFFDYSKFGVNNFVLSSADKITAVNNFLSNLFTNLYPQHSNKLVQIENSIDAAPYQQHRPHELYKKYQINASDLIIGNVGLIREKKGIFNLFQAYSKLNKKHKNTKLLIVGDIDKKPERVAYENFIRDNNLHKKIIITGKIRHQEIPKYLSMMDIFVIPSLDDGLSNSLLEAMAAKKAIVASDVFSDVFIKNKEALIFERFSVKDLYEKIDKLLSNGGLRKELSENVIKLAKTRFNPHTETTKYLEMYNNLYDAKKK